MCFFVRADKFRGYTHIDGPTGNKYFITIPKHSYATCMGSKNMESFVVQFELFKFHDKDYPMPTLLCDRFFVFNFDDTYGWWIGIP